MADADADSPATEDDNQNNDDNTTVKILINENNEFILDQGAVQNLIGGKFFQKFSLFC